jgi:hypothetical protein
MKHLEGWKCSQCNSCSATSFTQSHAKHDFPDLCECDGGGCCPNKWVREVKCSWGHDGRHTFIWKLCDKCIEEDCLDVILRGEKK